MAAGAAGRWFYADGDKRTGPVGLEALVELIVTGQLPASTLVWRHGLAAWTAAADVAEVADHLPPPLPGGAAIAAEPAPEPPPLPQAPAAPSLPEAEAQVPDTPRLLELRQRLTDEANWRAFPQLADELRKLGRLDEAVAVCRDGLRKHPDYRLARVALAQVLLDRGDLEDARQELQVVLESAPSNVVAGRLLGDCLDRLGDSRAALLAYKAALAFAPRDPLLLDRVRELEGGPAPGDESDEPEKGAQEEAAAPGGAPDTWDGEPAGAGPPDPQAEGEPTEQARDQDAGEADAEEEDDVKPIPVVPADEEFEIERPGHGVRIVRAATVPANTPFTQEDASYWPARSLAENDFPDLIQALHQRRWTGTMALTQMGHVKSVMVQDGRLVFASSSSRDDRLGELLLRRGRITLQQYYDASKALGKGKRLGAVLVEQGALEPTDLVKVVVEHTQEVIYSVFQWTEGFYRLKDGLAGEETITLKMSTPDLILEGIRRIEAWSRVERGVGGLDARYERAEDWQKEMKQVTLPPEKLSLLTEHDGVKSVREMCQVNAMLSDFEACRTIWAFRVIGVLRAIPPELEK
jgi:tetratricopeptide (TPR) repeat protein